MKPSFLDCHGCSLCLLPCPMWQQQRDVAYSPQGFAKALQHGANAQSISEELSVCIRCGACDVLCPEKIDLSGMIAALTAETLTEPEKDYYDKSCDSRVRKGLNSNDFYMINARPFHANHAERVGHYDALRQSTGCSMNLDLNRMAIPTGIGSLADSMQRFDIKRQIDWLLQGRVFHRIVVENPADQAMLAQVTGKEVIHVSELIKETVKHA